MPNIWVPGVEVEKDPADVVDFDFDFSARLDGDIIASATVVDDGGVVIDKSSFTDTVVTFFVSGGTAGVKGTATVQVITANICPRTFERSLIFDVKEL